MITPEEYSKRVNGEEVKSETLPHHESGRKWKTLLVGQKEVEKAIENNVYIVFTGGACNIINEKGESVRNTGRDRLNARLSNQGIIIFDPQIHPETHVRNYDSVIDGDAEKLALEYSVNDVIELREDTAGAVSSMEVLRDAKKGTRMRNKRVILIDGFDEVERILEFKPKGIVSGTTSEFNRRTHFAEYVKNANQMRKEFINMLMDDKHVYSEENPEGNLHIVMDEKEKDDAIDKVKALADEETMYFEISNKKGHFADLLEAFKVVGEGKKVVVYFRGGTRSEKGMPIVDFGGYPELPTKQNGPREDIKEAFNRIADYMDEVNQMRRLLVQYIDEDEDTDIVSSEDEAFDVVLRNMEKQKSNSGHLIPYTPSAQ